MFVIDALVEGKGRITVVPDSSQFVDEPRIGRQIYGDEAVHGSDAQAKTGSMGVSMPMLSSMACATSRHNRSRPRHDET